MLLLLNEVEVGNNLVKIEVNKGLIRRFGNTIVWLPSSVIMKNLGCINRGIHVRHEYRNYSINKQEEMG